MRAATGLMLASADEVVSYPIPTVNASPSFPTAPVTRRSGSALPPAEAKAPAAVVRTAVVVSGVLRVLLVTECALVAGKISSLARGLGIVAAANRFIQLGTVTRDVFLQLFHTVVPIAGAVGVAVTVGIGVAVAVILAIVRISVLIPDLGLIAPVLADAVGVPAASSPTASAHPAKYFVYVILSLL